MGNSASIVTTGTNGGPTETSYDTGEGVQKWVTHHTDEVTADGADGSELETTWESEEGMISVSSTRLPGESDLDFVERHELAAVLVMLTTPPLTS